MTSTEADAAGLAHAQAGRDLVLRDDLPGAGAGARGRRDGHAQDRAETPTAPGPPRPPRPPPRRKERRRDRPRGSDAGRPGGRRPAGRAPDLAARAGARARLGDGARRLQDRTSPTSTTRRPQRRRLRARPRRQGRAGLDPPRQGRRRAPARARTTSKDKKPAAEPRPGATRPRRAIWRVASRPARCSTSSRRSSRRGPSASARRGQAERAGAGGAHPQAGRDGQGATSATTSSDSPRRRPAASPSCATRATGAST